MYNNIVIQLEFEAFKSDIVDVIVTLEVDPDNMAYTLSSANMCRTFLDLREFLTNQYPDLTDKFKSRATRLAVICGDTDFEPDVDYR